jgi:2-polyprenyl-3-methyl-5-hydroxy-6-metoxy-1,4-benzoquinol methylase
MQNKSHWENIYTTKDSTQVSWFQQHPEMSLQLIKKTGLSRKGQIIDVGGGASTLVDDLLADGYANVTVLDISGAALHVAQQRLGPMASNVTWLEASILDVELPQKFYDLWHDRAVFHFLTNEDDRARYVAAVKRSVKTGGHVIVATFAADGPLRCSGLDVVRYSAESLHDQFGDQFELVDSTSELHHTPFGTDQRFTYCYCRKE